jgi:DNA-binding transcriptional ArsR family regulator
MVKYSEPDLDRTFSALADPTRRALLARLGREDGLSVSALAEPFPVSLPAILKHLNVLSDAGLIRREKSGRTVTCRLNAAPMADAMAWLDHYQQFWTAQLNRLADFVENEPT